MPINPKVTGLKALQRELKTITNNFEDVTIQEVRRAWALASAAFLKAAVSRVRADTGMSLGTFIPLAKALASLRLGVGGLEQLIKQRLADVGTPGKLRFDRPEFPVGKRIGRKRSFGAGVKEGKQAYTLNMGRGTQPFRFLFQTVVFQFAVWETVDKALNAGEEAFRDVLNRELRDADKVIQQFLNGKKIRAPNIPPGEI